MARDIQDLKDILANVNKTEEPLKTTVKNILEYFNATKRGWKINEAMNCLMQENNVYCEPDFVNAWVYAEIIILPKVKLKAKEKGEFLDKDPTPRISLLDAANMVGEEGSKGGSNRLISVTRDTKVTEAVTLMIMNDFSQLPILNGPKNVVGLISWKSIGHAISLGANCETVNDCKEDVEIVKYEELLFEAVKHVQKHEVVLIQKKDKTISGIVTATDISSQFITLAEPFLIIEQIENHLRRLLHNKYTPEELSKFIKEEESKEIKSLSDLTFGHYILIIENEVMFSRLGLNVDRVVVKEQLVAVRKIRNDVMHFNPEGITNEKMNILRKTAQFFHTLSMHKGKI